MEQPPEQLPPLYLPPLGDPYWGIARLIERMATETANAECTGTPLFMPDFAGGWHLVSTLSPAELLTRMGGLRAHAIGVRLGKGRDKLAPEDRKGRAKLPLSVPAIIAMRAQGMQIAEIARSLGCSRTAIRSRLKEQL